MDRESLRKVIDEASGYMNRGLPDQAERVLREVLRTDPGIPGVLYMLGLVYLQTGRAGQGADMFRRAIAANPNVAEFYFALGTVLGQLGSAEESVLNLQQAVRIRPDYAEAHSNLGLALSLQDKFDEAIVHLRRALAINPGYVDALCNLGYVLGQQGKPDDGAVSVRRAVELAPGNAQTHGKLLFLLNYCPSQDAQSIYDEYCRWDRLHARPLGRLIRPHSNDRWAERRLRVGYVSSHFHRHSHSFFLTPLFSAHDHGQFEIVCYSGVTQPDEVTGRLRGWADLWRDTAGMNDDVLAEQIRRDRIDILVDLDMQIEDSRNLVFAQKPAPVQACWLGYPGTTGLSAIDYRLTDPHLDPPGLNDRFYCEESMRLAETYWCYDPLAEQPSVNALPALANGVVTFGSLNSFRKVNAAVLELWARVLGRVEGSRLIMMAPPGSCRQRVLDAMKARGVGPERVVFLGRQLRDGYLKSYGKIDIGLDTFPYNGHTTSMDAFWMGVPVVTIVGKTAVGRAGVSQLMNLGMPELIANTQEEFVEIAVRLAGDLPRLSELRAGLREKMKRSPLMDAPRFARNIEAAYREMWRAWCSK